MNLLVDGEWRTDVEDPINEEGEFEREETDFRNWVGEARRASDSRAGENDTRDADPDAEFPAEAGRYHLYVSYACPWAHRTLITRSLLGLEDAISVSVVDPYREDQGWEFSPEREGCTPDHVNGFDYLRDVYTAADPDYTGHVSVPVLWDKERETIVNNESEEIMRMFDTAFGDVAKKDITLYPEGYRDQIDETIEDIYDPINNGVYRTGFARSQEAYDEAVTELFDALDRYDDLLADQRYLCGDRLTEADVAMFVTLVRFDPVYHTHFKCNVRQIADYENLGPYLRDIYQTPSDSSDEPSAEPKTPGVAETVHLDHIKEHYYRSHAMLNPERIVAKGPNLDLDAPHDRDELAGEPFGATEVSTR